MSNSADVLHTYQDASYTPEDDFALKPHRKLLARIFSGALSEEERAAVPAILYVEKSQAALQSDLKKKGKSGRRSKAVEALIKAGHIMEAGDLSFEEQNRVANWVYRNIPGASKKGQEVNWLGKPTLAHAYTVVLAAKHWVSIRDKLKLKEDHLADVSSDFRRLQKVWKQAFTLQLKARQETVEFVDVDKECISDFERRIFEFSERSGRAGNRQWGLDVGPCEDVDWFSNVPTDWLPAFDDPEMNNEDDLQVCLVFSPIKNLWLTSGLERAGLSRNPDSPSQSQGRNSNCF